MIGTCSSGTGVYGYSSTATGTTYGGYFSNASTAGRAVYGSASATTGSSSYGGHFTTAGDTSAIGVLGSASSATGTTYGIYGDNASTAGKAVYGNASATTGTTYGVTGANASTGGIGVFGYASATTGTTYGGYFDSLSSSGTSLFALAGNAATKGLVVQGAASQTGDLAQFQNSSGAVLTVINASGNVGIGTASPAGKLDVRGGSFYLGDRGDACCSMFRQTSGSVAWDIYSRATGVFSIYQATNAAGTAVNTERFTIDNSGYVGIGTTSPTDTLEVNGSLKFTGSPVISNGSSNLIINAAGSLIAHSDDRDQSFQRIATSVTRVRDGAVGCCF